MAKIDTSTIAGYADMSAEEKLQALEALDIQTDYTGWIKKEQFDKTASELAKYKRQVTETKSASDQTIEELKTQMATLMKESTVSKYRAELIEQGYDGELASATAAAMADGDMVTVFANQKTFLAAKEQKIREDVLKNTPKPKGGQSGGNTMTLKALREMKIEDRVAWQSKHPEEYKELYEGS